MSSNHITKGEEEDSPLFFLYIHLFFFVYIYTHNLPISNLSPFISLLSLFNFFAYDFRIHEMPYSFSLYNNDNAVHIASKITRFILSNTTMKKEIS